MDIKILGGKNEIGGNKILLEHKGTRIFLDFGMSFGESGKYFSEFVQPRKCGCLSDFFEFGLLPEQNGLYREDYLKHMGLPPEKREVDAVLLSHAHADHAQYIHFLRKDIPIFCTRESKIILEALENTGASGFSDLVTYLESFAFYENRNGGFSRVDRKKEEFVYDRDYVEMKPYEKYQIGSLEIEMLPVDHSLPGACGYIIYSDEGNLVYTGDIRFHGYVEEQSNEFVARAKASSPRWMISEGTRIDSDRIDSEEGVKKDISAAISDAKGLVLIEHPIRDLYRAKSIYDATRENGRDFIVGLKLAYLINLMGELSPFSISDVKILIPRKKWGLISKEPFDWPQVCQDYDKWEREFLDRDNSITFKNLKKNEDSFVLSMNLWAMNQLIDIRPKNALWIKSNCEPFNDDMELDEQRKQNWLKHFNITQVSAHASGHASGPEIRDMIKRINPENLIPVHTEHPKLFKKN